jgi:hypothetical protein
LISEIQKRLCFRIQLLPFDFSLLPFDFLIYGLGGRNRTCVDLFPKQAGGLYPTPRKIYEGGARNDEKYSSFITQTSALQIGGIGGI